MKRKYIRCYNPTCKCLIPLGGGYKHDNKTYCSNCYYNIRNMIDSRNRHVDNSVNNRRNRRNNPVPNNPMPPVSETVYYGMSFDPIVNQIQLDQMRANNNVW